jgi:hypothetical protein
MKNSIIKGLCVFFMLFSLFLLTVSAAVSAQSGHGGSTEVRARIEAETVQTSEATQPLPTAPEPSDSNPIRTGELIFRLALIVFFVSGGTMVLVWLKNRSENQKNTD